jgi:tRNA threonylcarbamoyladenosine biosynthesis protein TsaE
VSTAGVVAGGNSIARACISPEMWALSIFSGTMSPMEKKIQTFAELETEATRFVKELSPKADVATLVTLSGELGAGKTAFTKAVAFALGVEEVVTSPTFVLEKIYILPPQLGGPTPKFTRLVHIDAYRLEKGADLAPLGFDELMKNSGNLILLEWPEKVIDALPKPSVHISIVVNTDDSRVITYG